MGFPVSALLWGRPFQGQPSLSVRSCSGALQEAVLVPREGVYHPICVLSCR